jgi:hypothetical protein
MVLYDLVFSFTRQNYKEPFSVATYLGKAEKMWSSNKEVTIYSNISYS